MTVFSSVTATLSPELASCVKAKGKTWKDAFFDSLKALVGVEHTVYRKENQWQIKGEWNAVKKAHNILAKVALIEKDAIAAYHNTNVKGETIEETEVANTKSRRDVGRKGKKGKRATKRRRNVPNVYYGEEPCASEDNEQKILPKRKRGRPRKVDLRNVREESDGDNDLETSWEDTETLNDNAQEKSQITSKEENDVITPIPESTVTETTKATDGKTNSIDSSAAPTDANRNTTISMDGSDNTTDKPTKICQENADEISPTGSLPPGTAVQNNLSGTLDVTGDKAQCLTKMEAENDRAGRCATSEEGENKKMTAEEQNSVHLKKEQGNEKAVVPDSFSDVITAVAKEAIACASATDHSVSVQQHSSGSIPSKSHPKSDRDPSSATKNTENDQIFDYLGIKNKPMVDDFSDDNDKFSSEQSKKLEELIEKMIEKMDQTLTDSSKPAAPPQGLKYICAECPFTSSKKKELRDHMAKVHSEGDVIEEEIEIEVPQEEEKNNQSEKRKGSKRHRCNECSYSSNSKKHLKEHRMRKHREKKIECEVCQKKFGVTRDLIRHMRDHDKNFTKFACSYCGKKYKQSYVLKRHEETHKEGYVKPMFPCTMCPKSFSAKQVLQYHMDSVHLGRKPSYPCSLCDKTFTTKHSLAEHQLIHTNTKPYKCTICCKSFRHESTLKTHERLHTDASQKFTCEYCGKAFRLRSSLRIHRNIHTAEKRFECPICQKVFTQKQSLLRHARIHTGEKPYQCEICGSAFYDYSILRRHVTGVHKMQWKPPTQHYVLPPTSYKDGRVIENPEDKQAAPQSEPSFAPQYAGDASTSSVVNSAQTVLLAEHGGQPQAQHAQPQPAHMSGQLVRVYHAPPLPHTPQDFPKLPQTAEPDASAQNLSRHVHDETKDKQETSPHHQPPVTHHMVIKHDPNAPHEEISYSHPTLVNPHVYNTHHVTMPNAVLAPLSQAAPLQSPPPTTRQQEQQHEQNVAPMQSPAPVKQPTSPMTPMTLAQYPQTPHSTHSPLVLQSAYQLNQQHFYPNHH